MDGLSLDDEISLRGLKEDVSRIDEKGYANVSRDDGMLRVALADSEMANIALSFPGFSCLGPFLLAGSGRRVVLFVNEGRVNLDLEEVRQIPLSSVLS